MLTLSQAVLLGLLQGFSELFPISSLGHSVLLTSLLHWQLDQKSDQFLSFLVATHAATALVLFLFFWRDWMRIIAGMWKTLAARRMDADRYGAIGWLLVVGTIPAGLLGILFQEALKTLFAAATLVAAALLLNGIVLYAAELLRKRAPEGAADDEKIASLSISQVVLIGLMQSGALIPGFSRTGLTMTGGLVSGLSHENAARFSFLLATPIIGAAALLKIPDLFLPGGNPEIALIGALCAALSAWISVAFLVRYFETKTLRPFAFYCMLAGLFSFIVLW